jgi:hypothetical protein
MTANPGIAGCRHGNNSLPSGGHVRRIVAPADLRAALCFGKGKPKASVSTDFNDEIGF